MQAILEYPQPKNNTSVAFSSTTNYLSFGRNEEKNTDILQLYNLI